MTRMTQTCLPAGRISRIIFCKRTFTTAYFHFLRIVDPEVSECCDRKIFSIRHDWRHSYSKTHFSEI
jgi:hypothetical protein